MQVSAQQAKELLDQKRESYQRKKSKTAMKSLKGAEIPTKKTDQFCPKHPKHRLVYYEYTNPKNHIHIKLKPFCPECQKEKNEQQEHKMVDRFKYDQVHDYLSEASLFSRDEDLKYTFDNFKELDEGTKQYKRAAIKIAKEYAKKPEEQFNTIFLGKSGTGKSHLTMAILNYVNDHSSQKCLFLSVPRLLDKSRKNQADPMSSIWSPDFIARRVKEADLVVIDDLGAESATGAATNFVQSTIFSIYENNQRIITTTNLSAAGIKNTYDNRLLSRISEHALGHVMNFSKLKDRRPDIAL